MDAVPKNGKTILLVDDDEIIRQMYSHRLEKAGFSVVAVESATKAIDMLMKDKFDLLITDIMMAKMDGWELIEAVRGYLHIKNMPIIVITAFEEASIETKAWVKGASSIFLKGKHPLARLVKEAETQTGIVRSNLI